MSFQVSYGSTSFTLSDNRKFPFFFRSVASEKMMNFARVALVKHFNWTKVVTIHQIGQFFTPVRITRPLFIALYDCIVGLF